MQIPYAAEVRPDTGLTNGQLAIWLFLASETMLFGSLFSSYIILRAGAVDWPVGSLNVWPALANTFVLIASSMTMVQSWVALKTGAWARHRRFLALTALLSVVFIVVKLLEYRDHLSRGEYPSQSVFLATYFALTGFHVLHIVGGAVVMLYLLGPGARLHRTRPAQFTNRVEYTGIYWHFVDLIWIVIFPMLYLF